MTTTATDPKATALPPLDDIPPLTDEAMAFYNYLHEGRENARKAKDIEKPWPEGLGINRRDQQKLIDLLLQHGYFVCSSCSAKDGGYYIPTCAADAAPFTEQLDGRIQAENMKLQRYYRRFPQLRPKVLRKPPYRTRPTGATVDAPLDFDSATERN